MNGFRLQGTTCIPGPFLSAEDLMANKRDKHLLPSFHLLPYTHTHPYTHFFFRDVRVLSEP